MSIVIPAPRGPDRFNAAIPQGMQLVFFGTPAIAVPSLRRLYADGWPISTVITAPDKPVGRVGTLTPSPVKVTAQELGIEVLTPATLKDEAFAIQFSNLAPDLCIVVAYNKIIPANILHIPHLGFINLHPSLLPEYRGPSPIQSAILDGRTETGVSIMQIDEDVDHGSVLAQEPWHIPTGFDAAAATDELGRLGADLLSRTLPSYTHGELVPHPQDHAQATFTKKFTREDGKLDWTQPAPALANRVRALGANPGTWSMLNGKTFNIVEAQATSYQLQATERPGTVIRTENEIGVICGSDMLVLERIQLEGGKPMSARDFANGRPQFIGSVLQ